MNDDDLAKKRWTILQLARLSGVALLMLGIVIISGRLIDIPALGYVLLLVGAFEFFALPVMLAKRWKTPEE